MNVLEYTRLEDKIMWNNAYFFKTAQIPADKLIFFFHY